MIRTLLSRIVAFARRKSLDEDFDAELRSHLEMFIEENIRRGMTSKDARDAALRSIGNVTQLRETQREARGLVWIETLWADLKYAARMLCANPGFTLIAVLTLTLGVGVVTTVFTAYNALALKPLPVADPSQVVRLERWFASGSHGDIQYGFSYPEYLYCRDRNDVFTSLVAASWSHTAIADDGDKLGGQLVTANYFTDLGVPAQIGRTFLPDEDRTPGGDPVIVLSNAFWERRFHSDREVIGRIVRLNGVAFTVVGVAAKEFSGTAVIPQIPDFWSPVSMQAQLAPGRDWLNTPGDLEFQILARLKPSATVRRAEAETAGLIRQFGGSYRQADPTTTVTLPHTSLVGNTEDVRFKASVLAIMLIVGMVLLVGCVNIANMLLARGAARQKEISIRLALGASRGRVIRQLLTESLLLSLIGGAGGLLFSIWTSKLLWIGLEQFLQRTSKGLGFDIAVGIDLSPDWRVLAYAMALSLLAGLLFGLSPALQFSRPDLTTALKTDGGFGGGWSRSRLRSLLVATQVTVSMVLLISAGLLMRGLSRAEVATPGYETQSVYSVHGDFGADPMKVAALEQRLMDRFQNLPEVRNVAHGTMPLLGTWTLTMVVGNERGRTLNSYASDTYFDLFGIPIVRGRHLTRLESVQGVNLAVVSESAARKFWPGEDPIGRHFKLDMNYRGSYIDFEIIGVAKDVRFTSLSRVDVSHVYLAPKPGAWNAGLLVRTEGDSRRAVAAIRAAAGTIDPRLAAGLSTMNLEAGPVQLSRSFAQISALFAAILAALALVLAGVGIYGVMSYQVSRSVKEIGVRVALGARAGNVLFSVIVRGLRPVFCGLVLGVAGAAALSALLHATLVLPGSSDFFYGVPFYDPATFLGLSLFLIAVAAVASAIPARRALSVDPMIALRYE
jgi:predicted permease